MHMARLRIAGFLVAAWLALTGSASVAGMGVEPSSWRVDAIAAASYGETWLPLLAGAGLMALPADKRMSRWARDSTPIFASSQRADSASDALLVTANLAMLVSGLSVTPEAGPTKGARLVTEYIASGSALALVYVLKSTFHRERPNGDDDMSFPSGHAAGAFAFSGFTRINVSGLDADSAPRRVIDMGAWAIAAATAWARVEAGAHYPSDVLVGAAIGNWTAQFAGRRWNLGGTMPAVAASWRRGQPMLMLRAEF
jgi:membrane-associated phospholipid phosphatase